MPNLVDEFDENICKKQRKKNVIVCVGIYIESDAWARSYARSKTKNGVFRFRSAFSISHKIGPYDKKERVQGGERKKRRQGKKQTINRCKKDPPKLTGNSRKI